MLELETNEVTRSLNQTIMAPPAYEFIKDHGIDGETASLFAWDLQTTFPRSFQNTHFADGRLFCVISKPSAVETYAHVCLLVIYDQIRGLYATRKFGRT